MDQQTFFLQLNLPPHPKERPRFSKGHAHNSTKYGDWLDAATRELRVQWRRDALEKVNHIQIELYGKSARMDIDNAVGSVLDALVKSEVLVNDNLVVCNSLSVKWLRDTEPKILIRIECSGVPL